MGKNKILAIALIFVAVLLLGATALLMVTLLQPEDLVLNDMQIVLPAEATEIEKTAAKELKDYFGKITGSELAIVTEGEKEVLAGIYIGDTNFADANNVTYPQAEFEEGWAIKAVDGNLVLTGGAGRGVLYSVYHLLEDEMGVRWWTYWEEYVPKTDIITLSGKYNKSGKPAMSYRDIHGGRTSITETNIFCVRNRLNGDCSNAPMGYGGEESYGLLAHAHTFERYFNIDDFNANPEWFAYMNGGRVFSGQLCLTNQDLMEEMSKRVLESIRRSYEIADANGTKRPLLYDISANGQDKHCSCEDCRKMQVEKGHSGVLLQFVNQVAANVAEVYPEARVETLAFGSYTEAPKDDTKPAANVVVRLRTGKDGLQGFEHEYNEKVVQTIKDWQAITKEGQLYLWDFVVFYYNPGIQPTVLDYSENFKLLRDLGVSGYFGEQEDPIMVDFWDMKFWLNAKLSENPDLNEDELLNDFLNGYYGEAGPILREYLELMYEKATATLVRMGMSASSINAKWLSLTEMIKGQELIEKALKAVEGDKTLERRVRQCRSALDRMSFEQYERFAEEAQKQGVTLPYTELELCQRIVDVLTEQIEWRGIYDYDAEHYLGVYKNKLAKLLG